MKYFAGSPIKANRLNWQDADGVFVSFEAPPDRDDWFGWNVDGDAEFDDWGGFKFDPIYALDLVDGDWRGLQFLIRRGAEVRFLVIWAEGDQLSYTFGRLGHGTFRSGLI